MNVGTIHGRTDIYALRDDQRLVIETAHGLIEIRGARGSARLRIVLPSTLSVKKGQRTSLQMPDARYLRIENERAVPRYKLLVPAEKGNSFELSEVDSL